MAFDTIAITSIVVFGVASLLYFLWFMNITKTREFLKKKERERGSNGPYKTTQKQMILNSRKMTISISMALFVLVVANVALLLEQGFYPRPDVVIWWPRYVAYALAFPIFIFHCAVFLWHRKYDRILACILAMAFWVLSGLIASFMYDSIQWVYFGLGMVPLGVLVYVAYKRKLRLDNISNYIVLLLVIVKLLYVANWVLSDPGAYVLSVETTYWIYFGLDVLMYVVLPMYTNLMHLDKWSTVDVKGGYSKIRSRKEMHTSITTFSMQ